MNWRTVMACCVMGAMLSGCERAMHDMYDQPRHSPGTPSPFFANHNASRTPPAGTVAAVTGALAGSSSGRIGAQEASAAPVDENQPNPYPLTMALLQRGRQRYDIFCAACHGLTGQGDGMVVQRGFPAPQPFTSARLLGMPDGHVEESIRRGYGVMYPFADRIDATDRWAIVAYIRALQLSQHATAAQLEAADRQLLAAQTRAPVH